MTFHWFRYRLKNNIRDIYTSEAPFASGWRKIRIRKWAEHVYDLLIKSLVSDPSDDFIRLRDFVDVQNSLKLLECFSTLDKVKGGFNDSMIKEANEKLKLCKRQTRRIYEVVRLHWAKKAGPLSDDSSEFKAYRIDIKKRLNIPFQVISNFWYSSSYSIISVLLDFDMKHINCIYRKKLINWKN